MADDASVKFLVSASRLYSNGDSLFTGFHWPVLAAELAGRLRPASFVHYLEAGFACDASTGIVPTSTTDQFAYGPAQCYSGGSVDVLFALARRFDTVVLDAPNVDLSGRVNTTAVGALAAPDIRLPGGGGAADIAFGAKRLVLLFGGSDSSRVRRRVEHITSAPGPRTRVSLLTRWGTVALGPNPVVTEVADVSGSDSFLRQLDVLGVDVTNAASRREADQEEVRAAIEVLSSAADRGYTVARKALATSPIGRKDTERS